MQVNSKITFFVPDFENPIETSFISSEIKAGFPSPAADFEESKVSLDHLLIKNKEATFYAKASGNSMIGAGIDDGDILVIDRNNPKINKDFFCIPFSPISSEMLQAMSLKGWCLEIFDISTQTNW